MSGENELDATSDEKGVVSLELPPFAILEYLVVSSRQPGYWALHAESVEDFETLSLQRLPNIDDATWWQKCLRIDTENQNRGDGIKIGVIDSDFRLGAGLEHITVLTNDSEESMAISEKDDGWGHAEVICRILSDRDPRAAFLTLAPGADVVFIDASSESGRIDPARAIAAIYKLAVVEKVDIINLSWGDPLPDEGTRDAISVANELGVTVVAAGGNDPNLTEPCFPARIEECIAVGALGHANWGPRGTVVNWYAERSRLSGRTASIAEIGPVYAWSDGSFGTGLDTIAPGVGILVHRNGEVSFEVSGTSFAAPMVSGFLAVALARDKDYFTMVASSARTEHVRQAFNAMCHRLGMAKQYQGFGVPVLPLR
jgi:subtilisin family serine protease